MPSEVEFAAIESFIKILKPLVEIIETMGGQKWNTILAVRIFLYKLLYILLTQLQMIHILKCQLKNL